MFSRALANRCTLATKGSGGDRPFGGRSSVIPTEPPPTPARVAASVGLTPAWVRTVLKRWNAEGPAGLADRRPARNGGRRTGEEVIEHTKVDPLMLWAWGPVAARTMPPVSHAQFLEALEAWVRADMPCPR